MKKILIIGTVAVAMTAVHADTLKLTASDASGKSSFDTWNISGGGTAAPSADNDYVIDSGRYIRVRSNGVFAGNKLSVGSVGGTLGYLIVQPTGSSIKFGFANEGAILNNGGFRPWTVNRAITIGGTINSVASGPLTVMSPVVSAPVLTPDRVISAM